MTEERKKLLHDVRNIAQFAAIFDDSFKRIKALIDDTKRVGEYLKDSCDRLCRDLENEDKKNGG